MDTRVLLDETNLAHNSPNQTPFTQVGARGNIQNLKEHPNLGAPASALTNIVHHDALPLLRKSPPWKQENREKSGRIMKRTLSG